MRADDVGILVGTLHSGENEFEAACQSLAVQSFKRWDHLILENLPNREAHETLYQHFMAASGRYDIFLKLDADMVLLRDDGLDDIVHQFVMQPRLDHLELAIYDVPSGRDIWGIHAFTNRVVWQVDDDLFVDARPTSPGDYVRRRLPRRLASHCQDPSPSQAYLLGVHRAAKFRQTGRYGSEVRWRQALFHWRYLNSVWKRFNETSDHRWGLCILGAEHVLSGQVDPSIYNQKSKVSVPDLPTSPGELQRILGHRWNRRSDRIGRAARYLIMRGSSLLSP